jgi:hypothetical protein
MIGQLQQPKSKKKTMASRRVEVRGKEKRELMKRMKGRTWAISIETKDDKEYNIWEFAELQVKKLKEIIQFTEKQIRLAEWCEKVRESGKVKLPEEFGEEDFPKIVKYIKGVWDIQESIEAQKKTIKKNQWEQKFYTYMYNEYSIQKVEKYKNKLLSHFDDFAEEAFEDKDKNITYHIHGHDGAVSEPDREQGYIEIMNTIKNSRAEIEHLFMLYSFGVRQYGRNQRN